MLFHSIIQGPSFSRSLYSISTIGAQEKKWHRFEAFIRDIY